MLTGVIEVYVDMDLPTLRFIKAGGDCAYSFVRLEVGDFKRYIMGTLKIYKNEY